MVHTRTCPNLAGGHGVLAPALTPAGSPLALILLTRCKCQSTVAIRRIVAELAGVLRPVRQAVAAVPVPYTVPARVSHAAISKHEHCRCTSMHLMHTATKSTKVQTTSCGMRIDHCCHIAYAKQPPRDACQNSACTWCCHHEWMRAQSLRRKLYNSVAPEVSNVG